MPRTCYVGTPHDDDLAHRASSTPCSARRMWSRAASGPGQPRVGQHAVVVVPDHASDCTTARTICQRCCCWMVCAWGRSQGTYQADHEWGDAAPSRRMAMQVVARHHGSSSASSAVARGWSVSVADGKKGCRQTCERESRTGREPVCDDASARGRVTQFSTRCGRCRGVCDDAARRS